MPHKLAYDDETVLPLKFSEGWTTGWLACKTGLVQWRERLGLQWYWGAVFLIFIIPFYGWYQLLVRFQNAYAGGFAYEQMLEEGKAPTFADAWRVFRSEGGLTEMSMLQIGIIIGINMASGTLGAIFGDFGAGVFGILGLLVSPALCGAVSLATWTVAAQRSSPKKALKKFPSIVKAAWPGILGQTAFALAATFSTIAAGTLFSIALAVFGIFASQGYSPIAVLFVVLGLVMTLCAVAFLLLPLSSLGYHLMAHKVFMKTVEASGAKDSNPHARLSPPDALLDRSDLPGSK